MRGIGRVSILVGEVDLFSLDIEITQIVHVGNVLVADLDTFSGLFKGILVSVDLRQYSTVLQLQFSDNEYLSHSI